MPSWRVASPDKGNTDSHLTAVPIYYDQIYPRWNRFGILSRLTPIVARSDCIRLIFSTFEKGDYALNCSDILVSLYDLFGLVFTDLNE